MGIIQHKDAAAVPNEPSASVTRAFLLETSRHPQQAVGKGHDSKDHLGPRQKCHGTAQEQPGCPGESGLGQGGRISVLLQLLTRTLLLAPSQGQAPGHHRGRKSRATLLLGSKSPI